MKPIYRFIERCDAYAERRGISRSYMSRLLFDDGKVLDAIAKGTADITHRRLQRARATLGEFERALARTAEQSNRPAA